MIQTKAIDQAEFGVALGNLRKAVDAGLVDPSFGTISTQARLLTEHCMKLTPPRTVGQGRKRVTADIRKIFHPIEQDEIRSPSIRRLVRNSDPVAWQAFASRLKSGPLAGTRAVIPTEAIKNENRDRRGRAKRTNFVTLWKQRGAMNAIIKQARNTVGWARAGWIKALVALGGTAGDWIAQHGTSRGEFYDGRSDPNGPFVEVRNNTGWGRNRNESDRVVEAALSGRNNAMRTYFNKMMSLAAKGIATPYQQTVAQMRAEKDAA